MYLTYTIIIVGLLKPECYSIFTDTMDYDKIVAHLGDFGRYQKFLYLLICLAVIFDGMFTVMPAIVLATPKHR